MTARPRYPFTALVGQETMKLALVLNAINPRLGGVLIRGEKGTAKSTAARGLAALLPPVRVVDGCRFACDPDDTGTLCIDCESRDPSVELRAHARQPAFVELPIGATEDRVLGTLDLERALQHGERHFEPGLLARANRGLLYVDEVNLLPDHLVDALLDAAAMGVNTVEREGVSFSHLAAFVLVGTMNPEEGELRPQLLDRFGLAVDVAGMPEPSERAEVVRRRIAYESDPVAFSAAWAEEEVQEQARIQAARDRLPDVVVDDQLLDLIANICIEFAVDGLRADLVIYKASATLAAYNGRMRVTAEDVRSAAELALPHRRRRQPFDQPGLDRPRLDQLVREHISLDAPEQQEPPAEDDCPGPDNEPDRPQEGRGGSSPRTVPEQVFDVEAVGPLRAPGFEPTTQPRSPSAGAPRSAMHRRGKIESSVGRHVRSVAYDGQAERSLDVAATLLAAAPQQKVRIRVGQRNGRLKLEPHDLRVKVRQTRAGRCTLFVVDASGSMAAQRRMAAAKGAVQALLTDAYQQRDEVGLIAFRGSIAELLLPPTNSADLAVARLRALPTGGRTPLAAGLRLAQATLAARRRASDRIGSALVVLVSDGRTNVAVTADGDPHADALAAADALRAAGISVLVVDSEDGPIRLGLARRLCAAMQGQYVRLSDVSGARGTIDPLVAAVRSMHAHSEGGR